MSWYPHTVTVAATGEPITAAEAKEHVRLDTSSEDSEVNLLIAAARARIEETCGPIVTRTATVKCDVFADFAAFPLPLVSVSSVQYVDGAGATQTLSTDVYEVRIDGLTASLALKSGQSWPSIQSGSRITVTAVIGRATVPDDVKHALLILVSQGFDERGKSPDWLNDLLCNHRIYAS